MLTVMNNISLNIAKCEYEYIEKNKKCPDEVDLKYPDKNNKKYCIYHTHNNDKGPVFNVKILNTIHNITHKSVLYYENMNNLRRLGDEEREQKGIEYQQDNTLNYEGYYFPDEIEFDHIPVDIILDHSVFKKKVTFKSFHGAASLKNILFENEVEFRESHFNYGLDIRETVFNPDNYIRI